MPSDCISYKKTGYFSNLIVNYLDQKEEIRKLYNRFPSIENFADQIAEKSHSFSGDRSVLAEVISHQYRNLKCSEATASNITALREENTFSVTTGHQLNLFTGPVYFLYKIISAINLAKELKSNFPDKNFVPIYWMATEDHDFEEINYFNFKGKKFRWNRETSGAVGRLSTDGLDAVYQVFSQSVGLGSNAENLRDLFQKAYLDHENLADATRYLANELFGEYGLVIIDADKAELKRMFIPYIKEELTNQLSHDKVRETSALLQDYGVQVNPREINLFYLDGNLRERIILDGGIYKINNTQLKFSKKEILELADNNPEKFSPNVIMRPLYQEVILPNLCYIGGGGEIAYWLQLKDYFEASKVTFPMLLLRNSALIASKKQAQKLAKLNLSWEDIFQKQDKLQNRIIEKISEIALDFNELKAALQRQFDTLAAAAEKTDRSFTGALRAQERKQNKGLENLEKKLRRAEKRKHSDHLQSATALQDELFPHHRLQERFANFSEFYVDHGPQLIDTLLSELEPLDITFRIITI